MSKVSFVIPCYRSSKTIGGVVNEIESTMAQLAYEYEIVLVNDSSPDDTFAVISALAEADGHITAIDLAKKVDSDLIIGTDPDSDRIGVLARRNGEYIPITGNQMGCLLLDYIIRPDGAALPERASSRSRGTAYIPRGNRRQPSRRHRG